MHVHKIKVKLIFYITPVDTYDNKWLKASPFKVSHKYIHIKSIKRKYYIDLCYFIDYWLWVWLTTKSNIHIYQVSSRYTSAQKVLFEVAFSKGWHYKLRKKLTFVQLILMCQSKFILLSLTSETLYYFLSSFDQRNIVNTCNISHVGKNCKICFLQMSHKTQ